MSGKIILIYLFAALRLLSAQDLESARAFVCDRGVVDRAEPFAPMGNPALLAHQENFRLNSQLLYLSDNAYILAFSYPVSLGNSISFAWANRTSRTTRRLYDGILEQQSELQAFSLGFGGSSRGTLWGQQLSVLLSSESQSKLSGGSNLNDDEKTLTISLNYRIGLWRLIKKNFAFGLLTPSLIGYRHQAFSSPMRPTRGEIILGRELDIPTSWPIIGMQWHFHPALKLTFSNRPVQSDKRPQLALQIILNKYLKMIVAGKWDLRANKNQWSLGMGGFVQGVDYFAAFEPQSKHFRFGVSFAPEQSRDLIAVQLLEKQLPVFYPYRLVQNVPAYINQILITNKIDDLVEVSIRVTGLNLPTKIKGLNLPARAEIQVEIPIAELLVELEPGIYNYDLEIVAFQRGRQTINRQLGFELKDWHDWAGLAEDLIFFMQSDQHQIIRTARGISSACLASQTPADGIAYARCFYNFLRQELRYVPDPRPLNAREDRVQFPVETLELKTGDCEDLSLLMASLLESVGVRTAFIVISPPDRSEGHVLLMFDSLRRPKSMVHREDNLQNFIIRSNDTDDPKLFVPLDLTCLHLSFDQAWSSAVIEFQNFGLDLQGLADGWVKIIDNK